QGIEIKTGKGSLFVLELQRQGKKSLNYKDFMNGARDFVGTVLE
nr:methionyl-tRNA formyltransferase [Treponema sp.]